MLKLFKKRKKNLYILNQIKGSAAAYSLRRLNPTSYKAIRVRDDTATETDIGFAGQNLDSAGLLAWLGRNQVASIPLGVDSNDSNGISDGWVNFKSGAHTTTFSVEDNSQKINITNSTGSGSSTINKVISPCIAGNSVNAYVSSKFTVVSGSPKCKLSIEFLDAASSVLSTTTTEKTATDTDYTLMSLTNKVAPANTNKVRITLINETTASGNQSIVLFTDATVTITNQSAYVSKWYDQSGNGNDAVQATAGNQPRIVNAGVLDVDASGRATVYFDGTNHYLTISGRNGIPTGDCSTIINSVASARSYDLNWRPILTYGSAGNFNGFALGCSGTSGRLYMGLAGTNALDSASVSTSVPYVLSGLYENVSNAIRLYKNGTLVGNNSQATCTIGSAFFHIGYDPSYSYKWTGSITEIVLFGTAVTDAQRQKLERNQGKYYGIGVA